MPATGGFLKMRDPQVTMGFNIFKSSKVRILKLHGIFGGVVNSWKSLALVLSHPERYQITEGTAAVAAFGCFSGRRTWSPRARCPARGGLHPSFGVLSCFVRVILEDINMLQCLQHARLRGSMKPCEHWISYGTMQRVLWPPKPCQWTLM